MNQVNILNQPVNLTIPQIFKIMYDGKKCNDAKVTLHLRNGVRYLCIHKRNFTDMESALSYLREDGRNIVAPENRQLEVVS